MAWPKVVFQCTIFNTVLIVLYSVNFFLFFSFNMVILKLYGF